MIDLSNFKFDDAMFYDDENNLQIYLSGSKEYFEDKYDNVEATELVFVLKNYNDLDKIYIDSAEISPTRYNQEEDYYEDYDWEPINEDGAYTKETALYIRKLAKIGGCKYLD